MKKYGFCIIGGGVGGLGFADGLVESKRDDFILLEGRDEFMYTLTWLKHVKKHSGIFQKDYTGVEFRDELLRKKREEGKFVRNARVFDIDTRKMKVSYYHNGEVKEVECENIVLAVGGVPIIYGDNLLAGYRGAGIFSAYQVGEMLVHYDFLPGKRMAIYGDNEYAIDLAYLSIDCGFEPVLIFKGDHLPEGTEKMQVIMGRIKELKGGLRLENVTLDTGEVVEVDTLVVAGKFILERGWREKLKITWDLTNWRGISPDERLILTGDAHRPDFDFALQYETAFEKGVEYGKK